MAARCDPAATRSLLGEGEVTEENVMQYLGILEQRAAELVHSLKEVTGVRFVEMLTMTLQHDGWTRVTLRPVQAIAIAQLSGGHQAVSLGSFKVHTLEQQSRKCSDGESIALQGSGAREVASTQGAAALLAHDSRAPSVVSGSDEVFSGAQHLAGTSLPTSLAPPLGGTDDLDKEAMPLDRVALEARVAQAMAQRPTEPSASASHTAAAPPLPRKQVKRFTQASR